MLARQAIIQQTRQSHIGAKAIPLPSEVSLSLSPISNGASVPLHLRNSSLLSIKGPKGHLSIPLQAFVQHDISPNTPKDQVRFSVLDATERKQRATWGLTRQLVANAITGVSQGHEMSIQLVGVGYRASLEGKDTLALKLGYPNLVYEKIPADIEVTLHSTTELSLKGPDKAALGQFAAQIRTWRKPEPYNGKVSCFHYVDGRNERLSSNGRASLSTAKRSNARKASASEPVSGLVLTMLACPSAWCLEYKMFQCVHQPLGPP